MTLETASSVVEALTKKVSDDANVIWGARQDVTFGDTIKVMAIITGVGGTDLRSPQMMPDVLGDALRLTQRQNKPQDPLGFQRFD
jgi:cell division protein FtsZ